MVTQIKVQCPLSKQPFSIKLSLQDVFFFKKWNFFERVHYATFMEKSCGLWPFFQEIQGWLSHFAKDKYFFFFERIMTGWNSCFFFSSKHKRVLSHCFSIKVVILKYKPCKGPKAYKTWPWCMCNSWWMKLRERKRRRKRNSWSLVLVWAKNYYKRFAIWTIDGVFSIC